MSEKISRWSFFARAAILAAIALIVSALGPAAAQSWSLTTLYSFCAASRCADGRDPRGTLIKNKIGNFYGTTAGGGSHSAGTVFKLDPFGTETVLHSFCSQADCSDGSHPFGGVIARGGVFYGTTRGRGSPMGSVNRGGGVFALTTRRSETVLCNFAAANCPSGELSVSSLIADSAGNLYGTTSWGGINAIAGFDCCGVVFELSPTGKETVLYGFCSAADCRDGARPQAGLIIDASGNLYGTTQLGGLSDGGTVFEVAAGGGQRVLYSFCTATGCPDGAYPEAGLVMDASGNLYGTAEGGGAHAAGVVFKLTPGGQYTALYSFCSATNCADGSHPLAGLVMDVSGNLYGTASADGGASGGAVFEVTPGGQESVLYSFCSAAHCSDGKTPLAGLLMNQSGNLFGTTSQGGAHGKGGTVFELAHP